MKSAVHKGVAILLFLAAGLNLAGQAPAAPAFEDASIRRSPPGDPSNPLSIMPIVAPQPGGRFSATNMHLWALIATAWELPDFRVVGGSKEEMNIKSDITAQAPAGTTRGGKELLPMLRTLLIERFRLKRHVEPRAMAHCDLVLARGDGRPGPELRPV